MFPTVLGMVGNVFRRMTATAMGIVTTSGWIGLAVRSPIIGWISNQSSLVPGLLLLPGMSVLMILTNLALRPYVSKPSAPRSELAHSVTRPNAAVAQPTTG